MKNKTTTYTYNKGNVTETKVKTVKRGNKTKVKTTTLANYNNPSLIKKTVTKTKTKSR